MLLAYPPSLEIIKKIMVSAKYKNINNNINPINFSDIFNV